MTMDRPIRTQEDDRTIELLEAEAEPRFVVVPPELRRLVTNPLTPREMEVLQLIARGLTNRQIGEMLGLSEATIKAHCRQIFQRIGVCNRTEAALWARSYGLFPGTPRP
jgi:DNA-binding NarL/FixJ family response regulator